MDIVEGQVGAGGKYGVKFEGGKLIAEVDYSHSPVDAGIVLKLDSSAVLDALAAAIPGHFDDAVIEAAKALLAMKG